MSDTKAGHKTTIFTNPLAIKITLYSKRLMLLWTLLILALALFNIIGIRRSFHNIAMTEAKATLSRDILFRKWGTLHGGVYVTPTEKTPPNPYLTHITNRDLVTVDGKKLTLINPAYMMREIYELAYQSKSDIANGHLTSLKPLRPENAPDDWEKKALLTFESGARESSEILHKDGKTVLRYMMAFVTEEGCLKCHAVQGYKSGDVRGGLSLTLKMDTLESTVRRQEITTVAAHIAVWLIGLLAIVWSSSKIMREIDLN